MNNPYQQYKEQAINTLSQGEVLVKLFDETVKQLNIASVAISKNKDYAIANESLNKAQVIITTLASSLDMRYPISANLRDMYVFLAKQIQSANMKKDTKIITDIIPLVKDLRDSFDQADKISRRTQYSMGGRAAV